MGKIIAIGGGEITKKTTLSIDKEIILQSGKKNPKLLFVPTASNDSESYYEGVKKYFGSLGCKTDVLYLIKDELNKQEISKKILSSDIVYVGGGNTLRLMMKWRKLGVDDIMRKAFEKGIVLSGLSAGCICWFTYGNSDSRFEKNKNANIIRVSGLGLIKATGCPHFNIKPDRKKPLRKMMEKTSGVAIALDDCCAIEIIDDTFRIIKSKKEAKAYRFFWKDKKYVKEEIGSKLAFENIHALLKK